MDGALVVGAPSKATPLGAAGLATRSATLAAVSTPEPLLALLVAVVGAAFGPSKALASPCARRLGRRIGGAGARRTARGLRPYLWACTGTGSIRG